MELKHNKQRPPLLQLRLVGTVCRTGRVIGWRKHGDTVRACRRRAPLDIGSCKMLELSIAITPAACSAHSALSGRSVLFTCSCVHLSTRPTQAMWKHQNVAVQSHYACCGDRSWNTLSRNAASSPSLCIPDKYGVRANHCAFSAWNLASEIWQVQGLGLGEAGKS